MYIVIATFFMIFHKNAGDTYPNGWLDAVLQQHMCIKRHLIFWNSWEIKRINSFHLITYEKEKLDICF